MVVEADASKNYILIKGGVPGPKKSIVMLRSAVLTQFRKPVAKDLVDLVAKEAAEKAAAEAAPAAEEKKGE
jgi:large subunit ribosomal protein L3